MEHDARYCAETVRRLDPERYIAALFAREPARSDLFALYAFNLELATVREQVREPMMGRMRLQWWRDVVDSLYRGGSSASAIAGGTPVVRALGAAIARRGLPRALFETLIDARESDLDETPPDPIAYAEATGGVLAVLAVEILGVPEARDAARDAGAGWALTGLMRISRVTHAQGAAPARERLARARAGSVPRAAVPAFAHLAVADAYLARGREPSRLGAQLRIVARALRGRF